MYETHEHAPINQSKLSVRKILKESWDLSTKYFKALVLPFLIISIPNLFLALSSKEKSSLGISTIILTPIAIMGLHRTLLTLKSEGKHPTLRQTFEQGNEYWGRGFKIDLVYSLYLIPLIALVICLMTPSFCVVDKDSAIWAVYFLSGLTISIIVFYLFWARTCLASAAMADNKLGAFKTFRLAWTLTKGKLFKIICIHLTIDAISLFIVIPIVFLLGCLLGKLACVLSGINSDDFNHPIFLSPIIVIFWLTFGYYTTFLQINCNLIYQNLKVLEQNSDKENHPIKI